MLTKKGGAYAPPFPYSRSIDPLVVRREIQLADPDVPETSWIIVVLQFERPFLLNLIVIGHFFVPGRSEVVLVVMRNHSVMKNRDVSFFEQIPLSIPLRSFKDNVICLPFTGGARSIYKRRLIAVNSGGLSVGIGLVLVGIENLKFISPDEKDAAVTPALRVSSTVAGVANSM